MRNGELRQYQYFLTLAEELHFGRAAQRSFITQPALSQQISRLEETLGVQLFRREQGKVTLTRAGEVLREGAQQLFQMLQETTRNTRAAGGIEELELSIGLVEFANLTQLPAAICQLQDLYPDVKMARQELHAAAQIAALQRGQIDIGLGCAVAHLPSLLPAEGAVSARLLMRSPWHALLAPTHPLAQQDHLRAEQLCGERLILWAREIDPPVYDWVVSACGPFPGPHLVYETGQLQAGLCMARQGLGCMLLADLVAFSGRENLVSLRVPDLDPLPLYVFWRSTESRAMVLDFVEIMQDVLCKQEIPSDTAAVNA